MKEEFLRGISKALRVSTGHRLKGFDEAEGCFYSNKGKLRVMVKIPVGNFFNRQLMIKLSGTEFLGIGFSFLLRQKGFNHY